MFSHRCGWFKSVHVSRAQVIHSFGREDQLDREALARLARSNYAVRRGGV